MLRSLWILIFWLLVSVAAAAELQLEVKGIRDKGASTLVWYLFDETGRHGFPLKLESSYRHGSVQAEQGIALVKVDVPQGRYALFVFHDANENGIVDHKWYGPPAEDLGYYRHFKARFAPPGFDEVAFELDDEVRRVEIQLQKF